MAKIGRLDKLSDGLYRLQFKARRVLPYQVVETARQWKMFKTKKEALKFIKENKIRLKEGSE